MIVLFLPRDLAELAKAYCSRTCVGQLNLDGAVVEWATGVGLGKFVAQPFETFFRVVDKEILVLRSWINGFTLLRGNLDTPHRAQLSDGSCRRCRELFDIHGREEFLVTCDDGLVFVSATAVERLPSPVVGKVARETMLTTGLICTISHTPKQALHALLFDPYARSWTKLPDLAYDGPYPLHLVFDVADRAGVLFVAVRLEHQAQLWTLEQGCWTLLATLDCSFALMFLGLVVEPTEIAMIAQRLGTCEITGVVVSTGGVRALENGPPAGAATPAGYKLWCRAERLTRQHGPNWFQATKLPSHPGDLVNAVLVRLAIDQSHLSFLDERKLGLSNLGQCVQSLQS